METIYHKDYIKEVYVLLVKKKYILDADEYLIRLPESYHLQI